MLVSDQGLLAAGTVDRVREIATAAGVAVHAYNDTAENPTTTNLAEIVALFRAQGCDGIVGLGGGSSLDAAKASSALIENGGTVWDFRGRDLVPRHGPPVICIPTTCGTGAEVTFVVVITDPGEHFKVVCVSRNLAATIAIVDPELVLTAPKAIIAATGADALAHATESYLNLGSDPLLDSINIRAIRMIGQNLRKAVLEHDPAAIAQVSLASCMTGHRIQHERQCRRACRLDARDGTSRRPARRRQRHLPSARARPDQARVRGEARRDRRGAR